MRGNSEKTNDFTSSFLTSSAMMTCELQLIGRNSSSSSADQVDTKQNSLEQESENFVTGILTLGNGPSMVGYSSKGELIIYLDFGVQGMFALSDIQFVCVPGTHTKKFAKKFKKDYEGKVNPGPITVLNPEVCIS